ncbi:MAG: hypothetical protein AB7V37_08350 [Eubacteriaceae bacterium]
MDYAQLREKYSYDAVDLELNIKATENTKEIVSKGIYAKTPAAGGINLRKFEKIVNSVFTDFAEDTSKKVHIDNLKEIIYAIVYWKMSSQGGRAKRSRKNVLEKWSEETERMLYNGFVKEDFKAFKIGGVRIPTASAIIRFIYPNKYGIIDSRVVGNFTQDQKITSLKLRNDGYISDTKENTEKYMTEYVKFLRDTANNLNQKNIKFHDFDENCESFLSDFRPCDVEMALFSLEK